MLRGGVTAGHQVHANVRRGSCACLLVDSPPRVSICLCSHPLRHGPCHFLGNDTSIHHAHLQASSELENRLNYPVTFNGRSALMVAAEWGNVDVVHTLLTSGCDPSGYDPGYTGSREISPIHLALRMSRGSFEYFLRKLRTAIKLLPCEFMKGPGMGISAAVDVCTAAGEVYAHVIDDDEVNIEDVDAIIREAQLTAAALLMTLSDAQTLDLLHSKQGELAITKAVSARMSVLLSSNALVNFM